MALKSKGERGGSHPSLIIKKKKKEKQGEFFIKRTASIRDPLSIIIIRYTVSSNQVPGSHSLTCAQKPSGLIFECRSYTHYAHTNCCLY